MTYFVIYLIVLIIILLLVHRIKEKFLREEFELQKLTIPDVEEYVSKTMEGALKTIKPGMAGIPGPVGQQGPPGMNGGTFTNKGRLRSVKETELFLDRNLKATKNTYLPSQIWTLRSDGKMQNSDIDPKNCLHYNKKGVLEMKACPFASKWDYFEGLAQIKTGFGQTKCLTLKDGNVVLGECIQGGDPNQSWVFY